MDWTKIVQAFLPVIPSLVQMVEDIFSDEPKAGSKKKAVVKSALQVATDAIEEVHKISTGGQKKTWDKLEPIVDTAIESIVKEMT